MADQESKDECYSDLDDLRKEITKAYGKDAMRRASETLQWKHIPTGIFALDMALHGGIPRSQMSLIYGWQAGGKTTLALRVVGNAQKLFPDKETAYFDIEGSFDQNWAEKQGVDNDKLWLSQPTTGEQALDTADRILRTDIFSVIVVDSIAALIPYKEIEKSTEDDLPGLQARLVGKFTRKIVSGLNTQRLAGELPTVILLNQWRKSIGGFGYDNRILPGGLAQNFTAFAKIEILNKEHEGKDALGNPTVDYNQHMFKIAKNKEGVAIRNGEFKMIRNPSNPLGQGFVDDAATVATWARKFELITGSGAGGFYIDGVDKKFRILKDIEEYLYANLEFYELFKNRLISMYRQSNGLQAEGWL